MLKFDFYFVNSNKFRIFAPRKENNKFNLGKREMEKITTNYKGCEISTCGLNLYQHMDTVELVVENPIGSNYGLKRINDREMVNVWIADAHGEGREEYAEFLRDALANDKEIYTLVDELGGFAQEIGEVVLYGDIQED